MQATGHNASQLGSSNGQAVVCQMLKDYDGRNYIKETFCADRKRGASDDTSEHLTKIMRLSEAAEKVAPLCEFDWAMMDLY